MAVYNAIPLAYFALGDVGHSSVALSGCCWLEFHFIGDSLQLPTLQKDQSIKRNQSDPFSHMHLFGDTKQKQGSSDSFSCLDKQGTKCE